MSDESANNEKRILDGEKGQSVFTHPSADPSQIYKRNLENDQLMAKAKGAADERSYVLIVALIAEYRVNQVLRAWLPGYKKLDDNHDFTFSMRTELIRAANLIPSHILRCIDLVRMIRNDFAHNLNIERLEQIEERDKARLKTLYNEIYSSYGQSAQGKTSRQLFDGIAFIAYAIGFYTTNIRMLREVIEAKDFECTLDQLTQQRERIWMEQVLSQTPESVEIQGNIKTEHFGQGVVAITAINPNASPELGTQDTERA